MGSLRIALIQTTSGDDPSANLPMLAQSVRTAAAKGARFVLTPEVSNCVSTSRTRQKEVLKREAEDPTLAGLRDTATDCGVWLLVGSLALVTGDPDGRFANRSFLLAPDGSVRARYDKIHMFDVEVDSENTYRESAGYRPGSRAVLADLDGVKVGFTICYDMRFPGLYRRLAKAGAEILTVPSAFTVPTGRAHWHALLRARAIETGAFVLAPAQVGEHPATRGRARKTYGHSLAVDPWGAVLADGGEAPGISYATLDLAAPARARKAIPALMGDRPFEGP